MLGEIAAAASIASSVNSLFGGGGGGQPQQPAYLTGYDLQGTIGAEGIRGTLTGIDNSGKRHAAGTYTEENGTQYGSLFSQFVGDSSTHVPLSLTVRPDNFGAALVEELSKTLQAFTAVHPETRNTMAAAPSPAQLPSGSSLSAALGTPVQSGTPAGAVPVGGISSSASPSSLATAAAGISPWVWLALGAAWLAMKS